MKIYIRRSWGVLALLFAQTIYANPVNPLSSSLTSGDICQNAPSIFVSIASFRDPQCANTLAEIFNKSQCPGRITVGVCQQNHEQEDADCLEEYCKQDPNCLRDQVRMKRLKHTQAKGPTWARYLASKLWQNEDYYLQIDSHMMFASDWDVKLIHMAKHAPWPKAIISHYPLPYDPQEKKIPVPNNHILPTLCAGYFNDSGILQASNVIVERKTHQQVPLPIAAAGMMFGASQFIKEVPFDPHLPFLFHGEELLYSARLNAAGWRIFTPTENVNFHYYIRKDSKRVWSDAEGVWPHLQKISLQRLNYILGKPMNNETIVADALIEVEQYSADKNRLEQYFSDFGIDLVNGKLNKHWCTMID